MLLLMLLVYSYIAGVNVYIYLSKERLMLIVNIS